MSVVRQAHHERQREPAHYERPAHRERHGTVKWSFLNPLILSLSKDGGLV